MEGFWRLERPRLRRVGEEIQLVAQLFQETGRAIVRVRSLDEGETWLEPELVVSTAGLYPQLPPLWLGDQVAWMQHSGAHAEVCVEGASCLPLDTDKSRTERSGDSLHPHGNPDLNGPSSRSNLDSLVVNTWLPILTVPHHKSRKVAR